MPRLLSATGAALAAFIVASASLPSVAEGAVASHEGDGLRDYKKDYHDEAFKKAADDYSSASSSNYDADADYDASFYDRKAPNEKQSSFEAEKKREALRKAAYGDGLPRKESDGSDDSWRQNRGRRHYSSSSSSDALVGVSKEDQIMLLQDDLETLRRGELAMALQRAAHAESALANAKRNLGWFPSKEDKERVVMLEATAERHRTALAAVHSEEKALELRLKPLYGIVSVQFWNEQRRAVSNSIKTVHAMASEQTWWQGIMSLGKVDSLQEFIFELIVHYVFVSSILFFFGLLYFVFWSCPWTVYAYSSSIVDIVPGVISWLVAVALMLIPFALLIGIGYLLIAYAVTQGGGARQRGGGGGGGGHGQGRPAAVGDGANAFGGVNAEEREAFLRREDERMQRQQEQQARYAPRQQDNTGGMGAGGFGANVHNID